MSDFLEIIGAKTHNLKSVNIKIPKGKMTVVTGVSGSGKSSLAFNTIYNEGQRRYLESLSTYARMFIGGQQDEANVEEIIGLSPTISIDQKTISHNPRSTVGTITEIYDFYRLLFLNVGTQMCPEHDLPLKKHSIGDVVNHISSFPIGAKYIVLARILKNKNILSLDQIKKEVLDLGFIRFMVDGVMSSIGDEANIEIHKKSEVYIVVDRLIAKDFKTDESSLKRLRDSLDMAYKIGNDFLEIYNLDDKTKESFSRSESCPICGYKPQKLTISNFSFNSHYGACPDCHGLGDKICFLEEKIINFNLTLSEGAILPWAGHSYYIETLKELCKKYKINMNIPYSEISREKRDLILNGTNDELKVEHTFEDGTKKTFNTKYEGVINNLERRYHDGTDPNNKRLDNYITELTCPSCNGLRLKKESLNVFIGGLNIGELASFSVKKSLEFFKQLTLSQEQETIGKRVLKNIIERLEFLSGVGLSYITISRKANTLSGGEAQRIRLATQIGTKLEGIIYVLDEPSIGLHPRDNDMLINNLKKLTVLGNTLIVVEHDEDIMRESDYIIDVGPGAGVHGGEIVFKGTFEEILKSKVSETGKYLSNKLLINTGNKQREPNGYIQIIGAKENNLKNIDVSVPLGVFTCITGVSGSGKSSLINKILSTYLQNELNRANRPVGKVDKITGIENLDKTIIIDQSPIGKTPRSNPATYTGLFTYVREVFAQTQESLKRGYNIGRFSFNTKGGRCEECQGDGVKKIEMYFLPDVYVECESCGGTRYNQETLEVKYKGKNISEVLAMTVEEGLEFFKNFSNIKRILQVLNDVGLGYIKLGQSATTLSGGEAQRIKLATELSKRSTSKTIYILDEPTTGLHFSDIQKLLNILDSLVEKGNTILVIEHNLDVIANCDYIIDIGAEGGDNGGQLIFSGKRDEILECKNSYTGEFLKKYLKNKGLLK